jgi:glycosyltransferase involved in cell wall biosynthesis
MKIMHIISSAASGGAEIYVKDLCKAMSSLGNRLFIVFLDRASETGRDRKFESHFLSELEEYGVEYGFLGRSCRMNPVKGCLVLAHIIRQFRPDVIHSHLYYGAMFSLTQLGVPHIYTHHNIKLKASPWLYRLLDIRTNSYVGICAACESMLKQVTRKMVTRIDNGVSMDRILPKHEYRSNSPVKLVCVGSLGEQKNHALLLRALSKISDSGVDYRLTVAGEGLKKNELKNLVDSLGIEHKVTFIGICNNVNQLLHDADIFVMSSSWEGLPIAQIEATLTGLPVLVTDVGGCSEIVNHVGNGLVAEVEIEDYTRKLKKIIIDEELRFNFHKNALDNSNHYTVDNAVEQHLELYAYVTNKLPSYA